MRKSPFKRCGLRRVTGASGGMGSHGGGTRQGQKDVLDSLGITETPRRASHHL
ncbi:MAG: hypothetical protein ACLUPV_08740 [Bilophila wadsworthia]